MAVRSVARADAGRSLGVLPQTTLSMQGMSAGAAGVIAVRGRLRDKVLLDVGAARRRDTQSGSTAMTAWNELWYAVQTVNRASLTSLIAVATVAAMEAGAMAATPRRTGPALERLFDADLVYQPGMEEVVPATDREGVLIGSGDGVVSGSKL